MFSVKYVYKMLYFKCQMFRIIFNKLISNKKIFPKTKTYDQREISPTAEKKNCLDSTLLSSLGVWVVWWSKS